VIKKRRTKCIRMEHEQRTREGEGLKVLETDCCSTDRGFGEKVELAALNTFFPIN
jgi:hypothetical protein